MSPNITNITMDMVFNPARIVKHELVSYNYDLYIFMNFFLILAAFLNEKYRFSLKYLDMEYERFNCLVSTILVVFNTCMFLFHFMAIPLSNIMLMG